LLQRFVDRTKHFVVVKNIFVISILTNAFVGITKPFIPCTLSSFGFLNIFNVFFHYKEKQHDVYYGAIRISKIHAVILIE